MTTDRNIMFNFDPTLLKIEKLRFPQYMWI